MNPEFFCATCLTQGRKMFPVKYTKGYSSTYKDLTLTEKDWICWECNHFILKIAAFRYKAMKAQACLSALVNRQPIQLQSFSKLKKSARIYLEIIPPLEDPIKTEPDHDYQPDEATNVFDEHFVVYHHETQTDENHSKPIDVKDESDFDVKYTEVEVTNDDKDKSGNEKCNTGDYKGESIANATLLTLLNRKSSLLSFPATEIPTFQTPLIPMPCSTKNVKTVPLEKAPETIVIQNPEDPKSKNLDAFIEERLTEAEMLEWWASKKEHEFYVKSIPVFRCEKCVEPFCTRRSFLAHMSRHTEEHGDLACSICELRFTTEAAVAVHAANHYRILKCLHCPHKWDNANSMRLHCSREHGAPVATWTCDLCPREFASLYKLLCHARNHRFFECGDCGKKVSPGHIKLHKLSHTRGLEKPFACDECGRTFRLQRLLKRHRQIHGTEIDEEAYCGECNKQFRDMHQYNKHMKYAVKHASRDTLRYMCDECGRGFAHKAFVKKHIESKHSLQRNYRCETCSATFKSTQSRNRHRREKHEGYEAPRDEMCDHCGKAFRTKHMLSQHINTHTGSRPYACELCEATFGFRSALYLHKRFKHKVQKKSTNDLKQ